MSWLSSPSVWAGVGCLVAWALYTTIQGKRRTKQENTWTPPGGIRPLGNMERYSLTRNLIDAYYGFSIAARLTVREVGVAQFEEDVRNALLEFQKHFECLSCVIERPKGPVPWFVKDPHSQLPADLLARHLEFVDRQDADTLRQVLLSEHLRRWDTSHTLWRILVLRPRGFTSGLDVEVEVVLSIMHSLSDGRSNVILLQDFLETFGAVQGNGSISKPCVSIPGSSERLYPAVPDVSTILKIGVKKLILPKALASLLDVKFYCGPLRSSEELKGCPTDVMIIEIDQNTFSKLHLRAKDNGTTIQGVLMAATLLASDIFVPPNETIRITSAIDIRSLPSSGIPRNQTGVYVSGSEADYKGPYPSFWELAKKTKQDCQNGIPYSLKLNGLLDFIPKDKWEENWNRQRFLMPNGKSQTFSISNLGAYSPTTSGAHHFNDKYGYAEVQSGFFSQANSAVGPVVQLSVITMAGRLSICFTYSPPLVSQQTMKEYTQKFKTILHQNA